MACTTIAKREIRLSVLFFFCLFVAHLFMHVRCMRYMCDFFPFYGKKKRIYANISMGEFGLVYDLIEMYQFSLNV